MTRRTAPALCQAVHTRDPERPRPAADGLNLCAGCVSGMRRHLADLPGLYAEVVTSTTGNRAGGGAPVSGTRDIGLTVNWTAGELRSQIEYDLYTASTWVAADRGLHLPGGRVHEVCAWLGPHVDWLAASTYAADVRSIWGELVAAAYRVIDPGRRPLALGECVEMAGDDRCQGVLYASVLDADDPRPSSIWCDCCPLELTPEQWFRFGRRYMADRERMSA